MARRNRQAPDDERGSMHVMTIPIAIGMLTVAVLVITMLGSATNDRREAGTAADAAALAAAQEWDYQFGVLHGLRLGESESAFWGIVEEALLTPRVEDEMNEAARAFAERNGAELVELEIDTDRLQVTAQVRHEDMVPGTEVRSTASATAGIRLSGGLCLDDGDLGWVIDDECVTEPEPDDEAPEPPGSDPQPSPEPSPSWSPPTVGSYSSAVVLVD